MRGTINPAGKSKYGTLGTKSSTGSGGGGWAAIVGGGKGKPGGGRLKSGNSTPGGKFPGKNPGGG